MIFNQSTIIDETQRFMPGAVTVDVHTVQPLLAAYVAHPHANLAVCAEWRTHLAPAVELYRITCRSSAPCSRRLCWIR